MNKKTFMNFVIIFFAVFFIAHSAFAEADDGEENKYWDNGKIRVSNKYGQTENLLETKYFRENGTLEQLVKYDVYGHKTELGYYGADGKLRDTADGWAKMKWEYDGMNMVKEIYYNSSGRITETKSYNSEGDLVAKQYVGSSGIDPAEEYNPGVPLLGHETVSYYDSSGRKEAQTEAFHD